MNSSKNCDQNNTFALLKLHLEIFSCLLVVWINSSGFLRDIILDSSANEYRGELMINGKCRWYKVKIACLVFSLHFAEPKRPIDNVSICIG